MMLFLQKHHNEIGILRNRHPYGFVVSSETLPIPIMPRSDHNRVIDHWVRLGLKNYLRRGTFNDKLGKPGANCYHLVTLELRPL